MSDIAIKVENLSKYYKLGQINNGTLYKDLQSWFAKKLGKEDPNEIIGKTLPDGKEGFWALKDLNFEIKQGDRVGIIGRNGAGKSTLLKVISEITAPTKGDVYINGRIASLLEVGTGFHPELTGRENIYMNGTILGMKKAEITRKLDEIIDFAEIEKYIDTPVKRYSSGMYVRLAFAVAAHLNSEILIADEVLAVGDAAFQKKALGKMDELSSGHGRTILFVSHNMAQVKKLCEKGLFLKNGTLFFYGDIDTAFSKYLLTDKISGYINLSDYKPAYSDLSVDVKTIYSLDHKANETLVYGEGQKIRLVIEIFAKIEKKCWLSVSIANMEGILFSIGNEINQYTFKAKTSYKLSFEFDNHLLAGKYILHFGFNEGRRTFWMGFDVLNFEVLYSKNTVNAGSFFVNSKFDINEIIC